MEDYNNIQVRRAVQSDIMQLKRIFFEIRRREFVWLDKSTITPQDFHTATEGEAIFTALLNENIAGFISVSADDRFIHNLFVADEFRNYGIGKALIAEIAATYGTPLTLKCVKENLNSVNFYLEHGWAIEKEETGANGPYYIMSYGKK